MEHISKYLEKYQDVLEKYKKEKEEEGYVPTIEMLIEDLKNPQ